jgi:hypothetical protein
MAKPRIFISSTFFDLKQIREDIDLFIRELGYEPVRHETGSVAYGSKEAPEKYAYKEVATCDILICIIGGRFGTEARDSGGHSITQTELKHALERGIQVFIFIESAVHSEYGTFSMNKDNADMKFKHANDRRVYEFIEALYGLPFNNAIKVFESSSDIIHYLREQWAGLFQRFLTEERRTEEIRVLAEMKSISGTLSQMVDYLTAQAKGKDRIIESILLTSHPAFRLFAKLTKTPYRVFFENRKELETWLSVRNFKPVGKDALDKDSIAEWWNKDSRDYIRMTHNIFDRDGRLKPVNPEEWNDAWITITNLPEDRPPTPPDDDDVPF